MRPVRRRARRLARRLARPLQVSDRRGHEAVERRGWHQRPRLELGVVLDTEVEGVGVHGQLCDLHAAAALVATDEAEARGLKLRHQLRVDLVPARTAGSVLALAVVSNLPGGA